MKKYLMTQLNGSFDAEMQVMEDEGDEKMVTTEKLKQAALAKLQEWRNKK
jgi:hypothetical protein